MKKEVTCIMCPVGCTINVKLKDGDIASITGNACQHGEVYARQELSEPRRVVMSVVPCTGGDLPTVAVKTAAPVPKAAIQAVMQALAGVTVAAPVAVGDIIVENVAGLGVDVVATRSVHQQ
ncbi:MAG: DUF1667 domain-containing protein [Thermoplasmatota archaeon]